MYIDKLKTKPKSKKKNEKLTAKQNEHRYQEYSGNQPASQRAIQISSQQAVTHCQPLSHPAQQNQAVNVVGNGIAIAAAVDDDFAKGSFNFFCFGLNFYIFYMGEQTLFFSNNMGVFVIRSVLVFLLATAIVSQLVYSK